jgi:hypothetical protein
MTEPVRDDTTESRALLRDVFTKQGWKAEDQGPLLSVQAPPVAEGQPPSELAARFGRSELHFAFDAHDAKHGVDLVAPGGHVLRTLEEFFAKRGRRTWVALAAETKLRKEALEQALGPARGHGLVIEEREDEEALDLLLGFRLRYRGREHEDALTWVAVAVRRGEVQEARVADAPAEAAIVKGTFHPRKHAPPAVLDEAWRRAVAVVDKVAREHAATLEAKARVRLEKDASRLELFYATAIGEQQRNRVAAEVAEMRIAELEEERALKRREIAEQARVTVEAEPLQLLQLERPVKRALVRVKRKKKGDDTVAELPVVVDLATGAVEVPPCAACQQPLAQVAVDDAGHAVHESCAVACAVCERALCSACGATTCARGGEKIGPECGARCERCGETACPRHRGPCARCGRDRCRACLRACAHCGDHVCESDRLAIGDGAEAVLCAKCGVACASCEKAVVESELGKCAVCGRRFCASCLGGKRAAKTGTATCPGCKKS